MQIRLDDGHSVGAPNFCFVLVPVGRFKKGERPEEILIQTDWDYPGTAATFGWDMNAVQFECNKRKPCCHVGDGTVDCPKCGVTTTDFINSAYDYLSDNIGKVVEDPGYFE